MWSGYKKYTQATFGTVRSTVLCGFISEKPQNEAFQEKKYTTLFIIEIIFIYIFCVLI